MEQPAYSNQEIGESNEFADSNDSNSGKCAWLIQTYFCELTR